MWYSYAVVRVVPRVERGEFLNAGVVLFSPEQDFLGARFEVDNVLISSGRSGNTDLLALDKAGVETTATATVTDSGDG